MSENEFVGGQVIRQCWRLLRGCPTPPPPHPLPPHLFTFGSEVDQFLIANPPRETSSGFLYIYDKEISFYQYERNEKNKRLEGGWEERGGM